MVLIICETANYYYLCDYEKTLGVYQAIFYQGEELYFTRIYNALCGVIYPLVHRKVKL